MDKEAISTSVAYDKLTEQHFNGGYFSEAVKSTVEGLMKNVDEEGQRNIFACIFNETYALGKAIQAHPRFDSKLETINLSKEGLGVIGIELSHETDVDMESDGLEPYKGIFVEVYSFDPVPRKREEWIDAPGDSLGLETAGPTTVLVDQEPYGWNEHIFADINGDFSPENPEKDKIDYAFLRLFDARETLTIVAGALHKGGGARWAR